jgi:uncharacterized membrane protein YfcA
MHGLEIFTTAWIFAACTVFFAAFVRGVAGFGLALISAPILILILNPAMVVVVNLLLTLFSNITVLIHSFDKVDLKRILPMIISCLLGIPFGVWVISVITPSIIKLSIGAVVIVSAVLLSIGSAKPFRARYSSVVAGFLSGLLASSTSLGGPPVVLLMHSQNWSKDSIHPSLAVYFTFLSCFSLSALLLFDKVKLEMITTAASLAPALFIGVGLGIIVFRRINARVFRILSMSIIICAGLFSIISALGIVL